MLLHKKNLSRSIALALLSTATLSTTAIATVPGLEPLAASAALSTLPSPLASGLDEPIAEVAPPTLASADRAESTAAAVATTPTTGAAGASGSKEIVALEAVSVTAQKRVESTQEVPVAITAISGKEISDAGISTSGEVQRRVPNFSADSSGSRGSKPRWFIRGIGSNDPSVNLESPVGIYVDDVYLGLASAQNFPLYDLERVEVLRGPQGTLWGKNTTGGAVHFISRKPTFDNDGYARLEVGGYGKRVLEGAVGGEISDAVAARVSLYNEQSDGWATNLVSGSKDPKLQDFAARAQVLAWLGDDVELLFNVSSRTLRGGNGVSYPLGINAGGADNSGFIPVYGTDPQIGDPFYRGRIDATNRTDSYTGTLKWQLGDYALTAISSYLTSQVDSNTGVGVPPAPRPPSQKASYGTTEYYQASQEFRLVSPVDQPLEWILGYSWFKQHYDVVAASATLNPSTRTAYSYSTLDEDASSQALFGTLNWHINDRFGLQFGLRYTIEDKDVYETLRRSGAAGSVQFPNPVEWWRADSVAPAPGAPPLTQYALNAGDDWNELTYDITPQYEINDHLRVFFRYAKGFRSGNFNPTITTVSGTPTIAATQPEILQDYELGLKSEWLDGRVTLNAALFRYDLEDVQLNVQTPNPLGIPNQTSSIIRNAANGTVNGAELELRARPVENFNFGVNLGLSDSEYEDFLTYQGATVFDASGNEFYRTPRRTVGVDAEYRVPLVNQAQLIFGTDWNYRSHIFHNAVIQDDPVQETPGYTLGNLRVTYSAAQGKYEIRAYVTNVLDKSYKILAQVPNDGAYSVSLGTPRIVGLSFKANF